MLYRVSTAALIVSAGLASSALAADPVKPAEAAARAVKPAAAKVELAKAEAPAAVPIADVAKVQPGPVSAQMQAEAAANAPPPPPPPAPPVAAPSVAVAAEALQPAAKPGLKPAFAPPLAAAPPVAVVAAAPPAPAPPVVVAAAAPAPVAVAAPAPALILASAPVAAPVLVAAPVAPPAPPPAGSALVARRITDAAGAFDAWTEKAARIDGKFADAKGVAGALEDSTAFQAQQLEEGAVAYGALVALQDPVFVQSAKELAVRGGDPAAAAAVLYNSPVAAMALPGADSAATFVAAALSKRAVAVLTAGKAVKQAAYSVQASPWAKEGITEAEARLTAAKTRSSAPIALDGAASVTLMKRLVELRTSRPAVAGRAEPTPLVARALALATLVVLGEADEAHAAKLTPLLMEAKSNDCLKMAKLNLFQCLSVAGPQYEDVFCIGQHGLTEAGQCLASAAGASLATPAQEAAPILLAAAAAPAPAGVPVPIAILAEGGPERSAAFAPPPAATPAPAPALQLAQAAPANPDAPAWSRESIARRAPEPQEQESDAPVAPRQPAYARPDRGLAYRWDRQTREADYARAPAYDPRYPQSDEGRYDGADARYVDPRQAYGRYAPRRATAPVDAYGRPYPQQDDDGPAADERAPAPGYLPNVWGYR